MKRYCNTMCRSGYRADLAHGAVYGPVAMPNTPRNKELLAHHDITRTFVTLYMPGDEALRCPMPSILISHQDNADLTRTCRYCGADL